MYRLADEYQYDVSRYQVSTPEEIFQVVRQIPYVRDLDKCGFEECLQRPTYGVTGGDCDDKSIFAGAAFNRLNIPWRFVTTSYRPDQEQQHVYLEVYVNGSWKPFDATYAWNKIYQERKPYTKKIVWENPMLKKLSNGVVTLTGSGSGLGILPAVIPVLTGIISLLDKLKDLPLIGGLFKGKTQHVSYDESLSQSQKIGTASAAIYRALPDSTAKAYMFQLVKSFFDNYIMPDLGHRWDNAIANDYTAIQNNPVWKNDDFRIYYWLGQPVFYFLFKEDVERVAVSLVAWYTDPVKKVVWDPLDAYLKQNYGTTTSGGTAPPESTPGTGPMNLAGFLPVLGIGLAVALLVGKGPKGRK